MNLRHCHFFSTVHIWYHPSMKHSDPVRISKKWAKERRRTIFPGFCISFNQILSLLAITFPLSAQISKETQCQIHLFCCHPSRSESLCLPLPWTFHPKEGFQATDLSFLSLFSESSSCQHTGWSLWSKYAPYKNIYWPWPLKRAKGVFS